MKRFFLLLPLLLAACVEPGYSDPYTQAGAANAAIQATEIRRYEIIQQATFTQAEFNRQATATQVQQDHIVSATVQAQGATSTAIAAQATQLAGARFAQGTAIADSIHATQTVGALRATEGARSIKATEIVKQADHAAMQNDIKSGVAVLSIGGLGLTFATACAVAIWKIIALVPTWIDEWQGSVREWADRRNRVYRSPQGMIAFIWDEDGNFVPRFLELTDGPKALPRPRQPLPLTQEPCDFREVNEVKSITPSGSVVEYQTSGRVRSVLRSNALSLINFSIAKYTHGGSQIIPANQIKTEISEQTWQNTVDALKAAGCVYVRDGKGTFVTEQWGERLDNLLYALQNNKIRLNVPPTPPESV